VFPSVLKGGFVIGGLYGHGILSVRDRASQTWSAPAFLSLTGGSFGAQIGGQAVDLVLVIMNRRGLEQLVRNQFKIGVDAAAAAGPVGRNAESSTDIQLRAEILSYSPAAPGNRRHGQRPRSARTTRPAVLRQGVLPARSCWSGWARA
jgi:lipid-binding SYLF domain-containing protein